MHNIAEEALQKPYKYAALTQRKHKTGLTTVEENKQQEQKNQHTRVERQKTTHIPA